MIAIVYNSRSLVALRTYLRYGLSSGKPATPISQIAADHVESPGTKVYTREQAADLFTDLLNISVTPVITRYDLRITKNRFLPLWIGRLLPPALGFFLVVSGNKPANSVAA